MDNASRNQQIEQIFSQVVEMTDPASRGKYLDEVCDSDPELRAEVEELLAHDRDAGSFLEQPPAELAAEDETACLDSSRDPESELDDDSWKNLLKQCDSPDRVGKLGQYEVIDLIGRGGMGVVLRAFDPKLNRIVAMKILAPELSAQPTAVQRFLREARAAAAVSHDHVVSIHAVDDTARPPQIVMEMIDGQSLQQKIDSAGALDVNSILRIGLQVAAGLSAAHRQGLIHRDIKPANILLENGIEKVKLTDFGLARSVDEISLTRTGQISGTPQYMSPEQAQGHEVDHRTDLFSLGCVIYAMCVGCPAFRGESAVAVMHQIVHDHPKPIRDLNPNIPEWLEAIVSKLLAKDPNQRFATAQEVSELLEQHLAHLQQPSLAPQPDPVIPPSDRLKNNSFEISGRKKLLMVSLFVVWILSETIFSFWQARSGTVVVKSDEPSVELSFHRVNHRSVGEKIPGGVQMHMDWEQPGRIVKGTDTIRLSPGSYFVFAPRARERVELNQHHFTLEPGGNVLIRVTKKSQESNR